MSIKYFIFVLLTIEFYACISAPHVILPIVIQNDSTFFPQHIYIIPIYVYFFPYYIPKQI